MDRSKGLTLLVLTACLGLVLQGTLFARLAIGGARPDFLLLLVISGGLRDGYRWGATYGCAAGVLLGFFSLAPQGVAMLIYGICGFVSGIVKQKLYPDETVVPLEITFGLTGAVFFLSYLFLRELPLPVHLVNLKLCLAGQFVYNLAFIIPVHRLTGRLLPPRRWDSLS